jgi:Cu+-exporting ATPase
MSASPERELDIEGMTCASCVARVERGLRRVQGVSEVSVNLATRRALVRVTTDVPVETLVAAVEKTGFHAHSSVPAFSYEDVTPEASPHRTARPARDDSTLRATVALTLAAVVMALAMVPSLAFAASGYVQGTLALVVVFGAGWPLHAAALRSARHGGATMDTLVVLGANAALALSFAALARSQGHGHLYFETAAMIVAFVLLGRSLEASARTHTGDALRGLAALHPARALVVRGSEEREIAAHRVRVGDHVRVRPFERLAVDGIVREGASHLDLSALTGESIPVAVSVGDPSSAGAINGASMITVEATRVGADTTLARIVQLVERAQGSRAPVQRLADRVAAVFVPVVMALAAITFVAWRVLHHGSEHALLAAVSVLVVACPCALGLATPTAIIVGTGRAAQRGILLRDAASFERAAAITDVLFDKTGTLSHGTPTVTDVRAAPGGDNDALLALAAAVEASSDHPLARAITAAAQQHRLVRPATHNVSVVPGQGVRATVDGDDVAVGFGALVERELDDDAHAIVHALQREGRTVAVVTRRKRFVGAIGVADPLRSVAFEAIRELTALGVTSHLVSGDHAVVVARTAREVGIDAARAHASVTPEGKCAMVDTLRASGHVVAVVGDGINDGPALASADVGFAIGTGTDVAVEAASITLLRADPRAVAETVALARATLRTVRQNLAWAFVYNLVAVPLAATGVLERIGGPMVAAAAMAMSSVSVVLSSLRLRARA